MKKLVLAMILIAITVFPALSDDSAPKRSYEELAALYLAKEEARPEVVELEESLLSIADHAKPFDLWRSIRDTGTPSRLRAANGLALIRLLFPEGDPSRWENVSGFWFPQMIPKPLAAFDAVYYTSLALLDLEERGAPWLAQRIVEDLRRSSRAAHLALRTAPREYENLVENLEERTGLPPVGGWPEAVVSGSLPFAHAASSFVTQDHAMMLGMVFLNASGQPVSGMGPFAWDRKKGHVYRVAESLNDIEWWLIP
ncbi:MAG: hypothetical protein Q7I97_01325 [Thermovirgaceae bacterium]|nr:hypothetical protein [Thermovirgaceae bacterium]